MIARKILAVPGVVQQAAPGNVSTRGLPERCFIVWIKQRYYRSLSASGEVRGSRLPTRAELGKPNVPIAPVQLRTVKSGSPPSAGRELIPTGFRSLKLYTNQAFKSPRVSSGSSRSIPGGGVFVKE
jgi:hypothetical protein